MTTRTRKSSAESKRQNPSVQTEALTGTPSVRTDVSPYSHEVLRKLYSAMLRCRRMAETARRRGDLAGVTASIAGGEAILAGATAELTPDDTVVARPRSVAALLLQRVLLDRELEGACPAGEALRCSPSSAYGVEDAFHLGTGLALALKLQEAHRVVVAFADAVPSLGIWQAAFRFAGVHKLPVIYVIGNGAPEASLMEQHPDLFEQVGLMARDCGFPGIFVDGNDSVAVWRVVQESVHRARNGHGPTLVECHTRFSQWEDPLAHLEHYMKKRNAWDEPWRQGLEKQLGAELRQQRTRRRSRAPEERGSVA